MNPFVLVATLLASSVEFVEALTIVLAVGTVRGFKPALRGTLWALVALTVLVVVLGRGILTIVPVSVLQGVIGVLLLLFGLKWLRKAILRYSGRKGLHDEAEAFQRETSRLSGSAGGAFEAQSTAFNGVFLEGLEVVVIVLTMGLGAHALPSAALGAGIGLVAVLVAGVLLRKPLAQVPENTMKFVVGIMLTSFGTFWTGQSLGVLWPLADVSLIGLLAGYLAVSWGAVVMLKRGVGA